MGSSRKKSAGVSLSSALRAQSYRGIVQDSKVPNMDVWLLNQDWMLLGLGLAPGQTFRHEPPRVHASGQGLFSAKLSHRTAHR